MKSIKTGKGNRGGSVGPSVSLVVQKEKGRQEWGERKFKRFPCLKPSGAHLKREERLAERRSACAVLKDSLTIRFLYEGNAGLKLIEGGWEGVVHLLGSDHNNIFIAKRSK